MADTTISVDAVRPGLDAAAAGAQVVTVEEIIRHVDDFGSMWWVIAQHLVNRWIRPGHFVAMVAHDGRQLAPFSFGEHETAAEAEAQVRPNLRYYAHGWVVTVAGAYEVTA